MPNGIGDREQNAGAKLTVHLHVTGTRKDGYHLLESEMVSLDFADQLTFDEGDGLEITGIAGAGIPSSGDNLIRRALSLAGRSALVRLDKQVPAGGGLGGGSSDAAAVLRWAGAANVETAVGLGADVPFCLRGGRALVSGVGDVMKPLPFEPRTFTLLIPPFGVNTAAVYKAYDEGMAVIPAGAANHLEPAALIVEPRLAEWRDRFAELTGKQPTLAGSGATWFVEGEWPAPPDEFIAGGRWVVARTTPPIPLD